MKYRLRIDSDISGYLEVKNNVSFYSKDLYGWTSQPIEHNKKDVCLDLKDKKGNVLFHGDICLNTTNDDMIILVFNKKWYEVNQLTGFKKELEVTLDFTKKLKRFDFLFNYPEKEKKVLESNAIKNVDKSI